MVLPDWLWIPACERIIVSYKYTFGIYILNLLAIVFQWISVPKAYYQALARATPCHLWPPNFSGSPESQTACLLHSEDMLVKNSISHTSSSILCPGHIFKPRGKKPSTSLLSVGFYPQPSHPDDFHLPSPIDVNPVIWILYCSSLGL